MYQNNPFPIEESSYSGPSDFYEGTTRNATWAAALLTAAGFAFFIFAISAVTFTDWEDYILVGFPLVLSGASIASIFTMRRGNLALGSGVVFSLNLWMPILLALIVRDTLWTASAYALISSALLIWRALPRRSWWWAIIAAIATISIVVVVNLLDPPGRFSTPAGFEVFITVVLVALFAAIILQAARQAWTGKRIRNKFLVPTLAAVGVAFVGLIAYYYYTSVQAIDENENKFQQNLYQVFQGRINNMEDFAVALAMEVANNPEVQRAFASENRARLTNLTLASYLEIDKQFGVPQAQFHLPPATSFLRLHNLQNYGDDLSSFRNTVLAANAQQEAISGLEIGRGGLGVRGVVPVFYNGRHIGSFEYGLNVDQNLIDALKAQYGNDWQILLSKGPSEVATFEGATGETTGPISDLLFQASTLETPYFAEADNYLQALQGDTPISYFEYEGQPVAILSAPLYDFSGEIIGVVDIISDRTAVVQQQNLQITVSIVLLLIALGAVGGGIYFITSRTLKPVETLTQIANAISAGDINQTAPIESHDELGILAQTFNSMTTRLRDTLQGLEKRVEDRTRNLELAATVGRSVSQVQALDIMLGDACELILKEFNLYYVQVYLADLSQRNLVLEAGTGDVGAQLLERNHSLPLDIGSINGRAAIEKRSVVISDTTASATFRKNPLLPETRGEMAIPLIVGDQVVGVLDMQSRESDTLTEEILPAFEALAGQLAVAIQNAKLLEEAEQARAEVEKQASRMTRTHWNEHLDGIYKPEQIGYIFNKNEVISLSEADEAQLPENGQSVSAPISLTGEQLGSLEVEITDEENSEETVELVNIVARQVAQHLENLRLLESAERFRQEAEAASRRQTAEGWQAYVASRPSDSLGYLYDLNQVRPYSYEQDDTNTLTTLLKVRDEAIGKMSVQGVEPNDQESVEIINAVAERLSAHIESLRQYGQTQSALSQSQKLFDASRNLTQATDLQELVNSVVSTLGIPVVNRALLLTFGYDSAGEIEQMDVIANWWNGTGQQITPIGTRYPREIVRVMPMFVSPTPVFFNDAFNDERVDEVTMQLVKRLNLRAVAVLPLHIGSSQIGALLLEAEEPYYFSFEETRLFEALAPQIATVLDNRQQYERAQNQAEREAMLNAINQKIQSATSVEAVLQIAARELGHALGAPMTIAQLSTRDQK